MFKDLLLVLVSVGANKFFGLNLFSNFGSSYLTLIKNYKELQKMPSKFKVKNYNNFTTSAT